MQRPGTSCNDGNLCTRTDQCDAYGTCVGSNPMVCTPLDQCHIAGTCTPATGVCSNPTKVGFFLSFFTHPILLVKYYCLSILGNILLPPIIIITIVYTYAHLRLGHEETGLASLSPWEMRPHEP